MSQIFSVSIDTIELRKTELRLGPLYKKAPIAMMRALNRAADGVRTRAVSEVINNYYLKSKEVRGTIKIYRATRSRLGALVVSKDGSLPLDHFKFSPTKPKPKNPPKVIRVAVKKGEMKDLLDAFVTDINGIKIFEREGTLRLPITRVMGPSIPTLIGGRKISELVQKESYKNYSNRLDHEIKRLQEGHE
jgi:hypothetical protein